MDVEQTAATEPEVPAPGQLADCDLIMKGGITSGVVYPRAATHLAQKYRFRNLGGASAGAIAAAFVAAAEFGRASGGFARLDEIPTELGSRLATIFQPSAATAPMHRVLLAFIAKNATKRSKVAAVWSAVRALAGWGALVAFGAVALVGAGLALLWQLLDRGPFDWWAAALNFLLWLPVAVLAGVAVGGWLAVKEAMRRVEANGFGLCDGHSTPGPVPLTDWMHTQLQDLAGLPAGSPPLTFGQLWGAKAVADYVKYVGDGSELGLKPFRRGILRRQRVIDLVVMTTNLTQRRPHRFPFESRRFYWCRSCLSRYFDDAVLNHLACFDGAGDDPPASRAVEVAGRLRTITMTCPLHPSTVVRPLPSPADVPVLVGARLSLSFPGLISAVPLQFIDYARKPEHVAMVIAWLSDGGIASNFPMHLFDSPFPGRPTFGFDLQPMTVEHGSEPVIIPQRRGGGPSHGLSGLLGFAKAILETMQNWSDSTQLGMNTFSDRVPEIRLSKDQGGINLTMPPTVVTEIADRGAAAAALLDPFDLPSHQQDRAEMSLRLLDELLSGMNDSLAGGFSTTIDGLNPLRRNAVGELFTVVGGWADKHPLSSGNSPRLQADLRISPSQ